MDAKDEPGGNMTDTDAQVEQITSSVADTLINAIRSGATIEQAVAAHAKDLFADYPAIAAEITADAFLEGFDLGAGR